MTGEREYAGQTPDERDQERRERIIEAGLELFGTGGFASTSIEKICAQASISTRYFYAHFTSRENLLEAVFQQVLTDASHSGLEAMSDIDDPVERIVTGVRAYVLVVTSDPRRTRVVHGEVRSVPEMTAQRRRTAEWTADFFREHAGMPPEPRGHPFVPGLVILGATNEALARWTAQPDPRPPVAHIVRDLSDFIRDALTGYLASRPEGA